MEHRNPHLRDSFKALFVLFGLNSIESIALMISGAAFLLIDPYLSASIRVIVALSIALQPDYQAPSMYSFIKLGLFFITGATLLDRPGGTLIAIGLLWMQLKAIPPIVRYIRAEGTDEEIFGELVISIIPLAWYVTLVTWIKNGLVALEIVWSILKSPVLWTIVAMLFGLTTIWNRLLNERVSYRVRTQVSLRLWRVFTSSLMIIWRVLRLPYRSMVSFERVVTKRRDQTILRGKAYSYEKLPIGHIRLLKVLQRTPFSGLRCRMIQVRLSEVPAYEAISYCWGTDLASKNVIVDGKPLKVLESVYEVLHYKRSFRQDALLWIDSVCINQKNNVEKGEQIQLMRSIFSAAVGVVAWLGDMEHAIIARSFLITLIAKKELFGQTTEQLLAEYHRSNDIGWKYIAILFAKPWFTRTWMLQEVALAKKIELVFGGIIISWENLSRALPIVCDPLLARFLGSPDAEYPMFQPMVGVANAVIMFNYRELTQERLLVTLGDILSLSLAFDATVAHDKIYSVLGLLTDGNAYRIVPDYTKSVELLFTETMRLLLDTTAPLSVLQFAGTGIARKHILPSWVPDWTSAGIRFGQMGQISEYTAGTKYAPQVHQVHASLDERCPFIEVAGNLVDEIVAIGKIAPFGSKEQGMREIDLTGLEHHHLISWLVEGKELVSEHSRDPYFTEGEARKFQSLEEAFWRTLIADFKAPTHPAPSECKDGYSALQWVLGLSPKFEGVPPYLQQILPEKERTIPLETILEKTAISNTFLFHVGAGSAGRRIAVTRSGLLAIVPPNTLISDSVCVLWGAQTPFILRHAQIIVHGAPSWELVGSCFVHGLMNGEGLKEDGKIFAFV